MTKISVQMDPIQFVDIKADTTFSLTLEAYKRGHELFYYNPKNLSYYNGKVYAKGQNIIKIQDSLLDHVTLSEEITKDLSEEDVILLRQDPPFDMTYITNTHILETLHPKSFVVNNPFEVRNAPEKLFVNNFKEFIPETLITRNLIEINKFRKEFKEIIVKPLYGNGGKQIFHIRENDPNLSSLLEMFFDHSNEPLIIQRYLPEVRKGDCRIIMINGEVVGAVNRVPPKGEARSNLHVGGTAERKILSNKEMKICEALSEELKKRELILVGLDIIGNYLTEINVTSPTGIQEISKFNKINLSAKFWDAVESYI
ncbi:MAG: glutathione synthase [Pelagibacterales bacterium]|nr:glutathione synthase [Pelagibacterales bacterium]